MFPQFTIKNSVLGLAIVVIAMGFAYHVAFHPMDFRVYHYGARGVFDGTRPVYGQTSGLGWPMHYRYPPLFLLLFAPFTLLPLAYSAGLWVILKIAALIWFLWSVRDRLKPSPTNFIPLVFIAPYLVEDFRYGNAQFFVFALTAAALLAGRDRPRLASTSLALAIVVKVWPLFFLPYLAVKRDWKLVAYTLIFVLVLALAPSIYFGPVENARLLGQWFNQEFHTQLNENEIWFPNQSLRGVLMRYLTAIDYSQVPDANYPQVNIREMNPASVRLLWMLLAGTVYAGFLAFVKSINPGDRWLDAALGFCLLALLEPFTQKYALVVLLWPAVAATGLMKDQRVRALVFLAAILVLIQPLAPGASAQRLLQVLGLDFAAASLVTAAIFISLREESVTGL